jgi:hypothetical protein
MVPSFLYDMDVGYQIDYTWIKEQHFSELLDLPENEEE